MNVCVVRPPAIASSIALTKGALTPPLGVTYIAASVRAAGHDVTIVDGIGEDPMRTVSTGTKLLFQGLTFDEIVERIPDNTDVIGFSGLFSSDWPFLRDLVRMIGERRPDSLLVAGGEHFSAAAELSLEQCPQIDVVARGEGEDTMVDILQALSDGRALATVDGLVLRGEDGFLRTPPRRRIRRLDDIPEPAWDLVPLENYFAEHLSFGVDRGRSIPMLASRGCPYECTFCSNPDMWGRRWIARDHIAVVDEIERYVERYNIDNVDFFDLTAIVKRAWILDFCQELVTRDINITWQLPSGTRSEAIDREVSHWLYKSGCRNMSYAPETGSKATLARIKKKMNLDRMIDSQKSAVAEGMNIKINTVLGFPDDQHSDAWHTLLFALRTSFHGAHDIVSVPFSPYPGTEDYNQLVDEGRISHSDAYFRMLAYIDITGVESYCRNISSGWLRVYMWLIMGTFYASNYVFRPLRAVRTMKNLISGRYESRGEEVLAKALSRLRPTTHA